MPEHNDREFHLTREKQCQTMARQASSEPARIAHETLAYEHARRARGGSQPAPSE